MSIANNLFQHLIIGVHRSGYWNIQILNQRSTPEGAKVKQVQDDHAAHGLTLPCPSSFCQDDGDRPLPLNLELL